MTKTPPPEPVHRTPRRPGETPAARRAALHETAWASLAHAALHGADPAARIAMGQAVLDLLVNDAPLPPAARDWTILVIAEAMRRGKLPTSHRSRPSNPRKTIDRTIRIARRFIELRRTDPASALPDRYAIIADEFSLSESAVEKLYKRRDFKDLLNLFDEGP